MRWNSTFRMMFRALQNKGAITQFQKRRPQADPREHAYSIILDLLDDEDWAEIKQYLSILRHFVEARAHLEGNAEEMGTQVMRGGAWEVYPWLQVIFAKIDVALLVEKTKATRLKLGRDSLLLLLLMAKRSLTSTGGR